MCADVYARGLDRAFRLGRRQQMNLSVTCRPNTAGTASCEHQWSPRVVVSDTGDHSEVWTCYRCGMERSSNPTRT